MEKETYLPGTPQAIEQGCTCQPWDGEPRVIETYPLWLVDGCPIHDPREDSNKE